MDMPVVRLTRSSKKSSASPVDQTDRTECAEVSAKIETQRARSCEKKTMVESGTAPERKEQVPSSEGSGTPRSANCSTEEVYLSPATRRQSIHSASTPDLLNFTGNDDEQERRQRRRSRVVDLQLDSPFRASPSRRQQEASATDIQKLTNAQLSEHYSTCIKLSTENKITTKNAFGLHLIDYMADILKQKDSELTNFKMAAGTLDASAKIYAVRVDAVHADVYKVLGGLDVPAQSSESVGGEQTGNTDAEDIKKPQKRKKKESCKTIEQNLKNINRPDLKQKFEIDPMFEKAASFDECSASGVFLSYLHFYDNHCELLFDCAVKPLVICESPELPPLIGTEESDLKGTLPPSLDSRTICSSLAGFSFTQWDSEEHEETATVMLEKFRKSERVFDVNAEPEMDNNDTCSAGISMVDDFDGDAYDNSENLTRTAERRTAFAKDRAQCRKDVIPLEEADIGAMCLQLSRKPGEYSYFSPRTMTMWRGPEHWRFKPHQKADNTTDKKAKKKKEKKTFLLDFSADVNFETYLKETRAATVLNKVTLDRRSKKATTLPADFRYDPDNLMQFSLKPIYIVKRSPSKTLGADHDDGLDDYNYNNPNDTTNFCPALQDADGDEDEQDMFDFGADQTTNLGETRLINEINGLNITTYGEENLIAEPQKVNKIVLNYAKTAKKMDMKRLKLTMWDLLQNVDNQVEKPYPTENGVTEVAFENPDEISRMAEMKTFSDVARSLIPRLPKLMAENLSIPLAFACLLHLANEKNLKLSGVKDLCDVLIEQDS